MPIVISEKFIFNNIAILFEAWEERTCPPQRIFLYDPDQEGMRPLATVLLSGDVIQFNAPKCDITNIVNGAKMFLKSGYYNQMSFQKFLELIS